MTDALHADGTMRANIELSQREPVTPFDASDDDAQLEVLGIVEAALAGRD